MFLRGVVVLLGLVAVLQPLADLLVLLPALLHPLGLALLVVLSLALRYPLSLALNTTRRVTVRSNHHQDQSHLLLVLCPTFLPPLCGTFLLGFLLADLQSGKLLQDDIYSVAW